MACSWSWSVLCSSCPLPAVPLWNKRPHASIRGNGFKVSIGFFYPLIIFIHTYWFIIHLFLYLPALFDHFGRAHPCTLWIQASNWILVCVPRWATKFNVFMGPRGVSTSKRSLNVVFYSEDSVVPTGACSLTLKGYVSRQNQPKKKSFWKQLWKKAFYQGGDEKFRPLWAGVRQIQPGKHQIVGMVSFQVGFLEHRERIFVSLSPCVSSSHFLHFSKPFIQATNQQEFWRVTIIFFRLWSMFDVFLPGSARTTPTSAARSGGAEANNQTIKEQGAADPTISGGVASSVCILISWQGVFKDYRLDGCV